MSSTNRDTGGKFVDYYRTPMEPIRVFLDEFLVCEPAAFRGIVVDPCAGGDADHPMSYPAVLSEYGVHPLTFDLRPDSPAAKHLDYLATPLPPKVKCFISNPPFSSAQEFIEKALREVTEDGFVVFLLRLNFFETKKRKPLFDAHPPKYAFVHSERMSFTPDGKRDSVAYMHCVWQKGYEGFTQLKVI